MLEDDALRLTLTPAYLPGIVIFADASLKRACARDTEHELEVNGHT